MSGRRTSRALALAVALLLGAVPGALAASPAAERAADQVFEDYATDGQIDPCEHTTRTLELARGNVRPDVQQYASEYPAAIAAALAARARGACDDGSADQESGAGTLTTPPAPTGTPVPAPTASPEPGAPTETVVPDPPAPAAGGGAAPPGGQDPGLERATSAEPDSGAPLPLVVLGAVLVAGALLALVLLLARRAGIGQDRLAPAGHAWREARWRWRGVWDDFGDWLSRGR